jgi:hypothetical protein
METILEEIIMKRKTILVSSVTAILLAGIFIWYTLPVDLMDLDHKEVLELVVFNGSSGNATHITDKEQIQHIIDDLNDVEIKRTRPSMGYSGYGYYLFTCPTGMKPVTGIISLSIRRIPLEKIPFFILL